MVARRVTVAVTGLVVACSPGEVAPLGTAAQHPAQRSSPLAARPQLVRSDSIVDPAPGWSVSATAVVPRVRAFRRPGAARPFALFRNPNEYGQRSVFLVKELTDRWLHVYLPMRPNGATGWIPSRGVALSENPFRVSVDLGSNRLTLRKGERLMMRERVAAGTGGTPTPTGSFYTTMEVRTGDPVGAHGPYIQVLSAYSEVLFSFGGGDGKVGIHGTNAPSLVGSDVSHGCIRMRNPAITRLTRLIPAGTPVHIRR